MLADDSNDDFGLVDAVSRLAGYDALKRLKLRFGGTRVYIPAAKSLHDEHPLVQTIGARAAAKVCDELHRTRQYVPKPVTIDIEQIVLWATRAELERKEAARLAGCTETYVYMIIAAAREAGFLPSKGEAPLWQLLGYDRPDAGSPRSEMIMCAGKVEEVQHWPIVKWARLAGLPVLDIAQMIDSSQHRVLRISGWLRKAGILPKVARA